MARLRLGGWWLVVGLLALDQYSKIWIRQNFFVGEVLELVNWFNLTLVYNSGMAFGFLSRQSGWQTPLLVVVTAALLVWLSVTWYRTKSSVARLALLLVIAGAMGNLIDRLYLGAVVDFIQWHVGRWYWPVFNLADAYICTGVAVFLWVELVVWGKKTRD